MLLVHEDFDFDIPLAQPDGAYDLEAPQMRTEQDTSLATSQAVLEYVESPYLDVKVAGLAGEKIDAIKECRRETMKLSI
jgi:ribosomal protein L7/L12